MIRLIFSDLHFGDPDSSFSLLELTDITRVLLSPKFPRQVSELILAGDIIDANISTLTTAIEGKLGFRRWLELLHQSNINFIVTDDNKITLYEISVNGKENVIHTETY